MFHISKSYIVITKGIFLSATSYFIIFIKKKKFFIFISNSLLQFFRLKEFDKKNFFNINFMIERSVFSYSRDFFHTLLSHYYIQTNHLHYTKRILCSSNNWFFSNINTLQEKYIHFWQLLMQLLHLIANFSFKTKTQSILPIFSPEDWSEIKIEVDDASKQNAMIDGSDFWECFWQQSTHDAVLRKVTITRSTGSEIKTPKNGIR